MIEGYWRTTQAAGQLGIPPRQLRKLCEAGLVEAEQTAGGQWRIPMAEVERLKREGVPPAPLTAEAETKPKAAQQNGSAVLLAPPSSAVVDAAEQALISENTLKTKRNHVDVRRLEREEAEVNDFFTERERRQAETEEARRQRELEQQAQVQREIHAQKAATARQEWRDEWIGHALRSRPWYAPETVAADIAEQVDVVLEALDPSRDYSLTRRLVDAAVETVLQPWRKRKEKAAAIEAVLGRLDFNMKYDPVWKSRAQEAAAEAIERLSDGSTQSQMETAGTAAVQPLIREFGHATKCQELASNVWTKLRNETPGDRQDAQDAVRAALSALPIEASQRQIEQARDAAILPIQEAIDEREEGKRVSAAALLDRQMREEIISRLGWKLPYGISDKLKSKAEEELRREMDELPQGTPRRELERIRDRVGEATKKAHERRQKKEGLIDHAVSEIYRYILKLENDFEFDKGAYSLEQEIREPIRKALWEELKGKETLPTPEQMIGIVRRLVREKLDIED